VQSSSAVLEECEAIFNPDNKFCYDGTVYDKCNGKIFNPPTQVCVSGKVEDKCGGFQYNQETQFCYEGSIYDKCGVKIGTTIYTIYNPITQGCLYGKIVDGKCENDWYDKTTRFCYNGVVYAKCDGMDYPPVTHICQNGLAFPAKCEGESYNPLTHYCINGTVENRDFIDVRDGKKYKVIGIGTQVWMSENLNYDVSGSVCADKVPANCAKYGRLYNWKTAMSVCPTGWHLPSSAEWDTLVDFVGKNAAGTKLKATNGWDENNYFDKGTDDYGFSALPGGSGDNDGKFYSVGRVGMWWTATEIMAYNPLDAYYRSITRFNSDTGVLSGQSANKLQNLYSVRCLKD